MRSPELPVIARSDPVASPPLCDTTAKNMVFTPHPSPESGFEAPPVWEVALSAWCGGHVLDPYDVRGVHSLFSSDLPEVEQKGPVAHLQVAALVGGPPPADGFGEIPPARWWFISEDQTRLLQLQEQFLGVNWRRPRHSLPGDRIDYPGFDVVFDEAKMRVAELEKFAAAQGRRFPRPTACEVLYDNLLPLADREGQRIKLSDALQEFQSADGRPRIGFSMEWLEKFDELPETDHSIIKIAFAVAAAMFEGHEEPVPVLKLTFTAGAVRDSWDGTYSFFEAANAYIRRRLMTLTTERMHELWLPK